VILRCATDAGLTPGAYYTPDGIEAPDPQAVDPVAVDELWGLSEQIVAPWL
jgi:hypothetical protein